MTEADERALSPKQIELSAEGIAKVEAIEALGWLHLLPSQISASGSSAEEHVRHLLATLSEQISECSPLLSSTKAAESAEGRRLLTRLETAVSALNEEHRTHEATEISAALLSRLPTIGTSLSRKGR